MLHRLTRPFRALVARSTAPPRLGPGTDPERLHTGLGEFLRTDPAAWRRLFLRGKVIARTPGNDDVLTRCAAAGLVTPAPLGLVVPSVRLFPLPGAFVATDLLSYEAADQVFSLGLEQTYLLRRLDVRAGDRVLDLCTGSGVNAVFASDAAGHVVAADVSERALEFAAFNTALNPGGVPVELRRGSLFEPLASGETFDVILVNPPFEPVPPGAAHFLHSAGGEDGLDLIREMLPGVPSRLRPGGRFFMVTWTPAAGDDTLLARLLADTFRGRRIDVHLLDDWPLEVRIRAFRRHPGYDAWHARLRAAGHTSIRLVWTRVGPEPGGVVAITPSADVAACNGDAEEWVFDAP